MADRFHVNNDQNVGKCKASKKSCPFGGEDQHYATREEAEKVAEKRLEEKYSLVNTLYKRKSSNVQDNADVNEMKPSLKKKIIEESTSGSIRLHPSVVGKVFSQDKDEFVRRNVAEKIKSQKLISSMSSDDSAKIRSIVARRSNNPRVIQEIASDADPEVRKIARRNDRMPKRAIKNMEEKEKRDSERIKAVVESQSDNFKSTKKPITKESQYGEKFVDSNGNLWINDTLSSERSTKSVRVRKVKRNKNGTYESIRMDENSPNLSHFKEVKRDRAYLTHEISSLENSPGRHQYGFPEDEMTRYNIEKNIRDHKKELEELEAKESQKE